MSKKHKTASQCKFCRRENMKLYLKGERCFSERCAYERRPYPPGQHGQKRPKFSEYSLRLREKQKVRRIYGVLERQFRRYFELADRKKGATGENLLILLERRLNNVVYQMGFASTRAEARQLIRHNHFLVNSKKVNIPSYLVRVGDVISVREKSRNISKIKEAAERKKAQTPPSWLEINYSKFEGKVKALPSREDITIPIQERLIVEFYSR
jgi:small subunit ribosomal protein S4